MSVPALNHMTAHFLLQFAHKTLTSEEFKDFFMQHFESDEKIRENLNKVDWNVRAFCCCSLNRHSRGCMSQAYLPLSPRMMIPC